MKTGLGLKTAKGNRTERIAPSRAIDRLDMSGQRVVGRTYRNTRRLGHLTSCRCNVYVVVDECCSAAAAAATIGWPVIIDLSR